MNSEEMIEQQPNDVKGDTMAEKSLLWARINDLEDGIEKVLKAAKVFIDGRPEDFDYTPGERELIEEFAYLGELIGFDGNE